MSSGQLTYFQTDRFVKSGNHPVMNLILGKLLKLLKTLKLLLLLKK